VLVATASLELGIDIGDVDLICQLGSPRLISTFLQRVGRSGHAVGGTPKGRLFPTTRDELVESAALLDSVRRQELEALKIAEGALDVLAQQIVAETALREWPESELLNLCRRAWPYRELSKDTFDGIVDMLANGFSTRRGRRGALVYHDAVNGRLRGRKSARLTALTNGGTIPDQFDYDVVLEPEDQVIGSLNEDFAFESLPGDIFQLGNTSYRIQKVERGVVRVTDARGAPPNIPFWFGEAPGRSDELSASVSRLREEFERRWNGERDSAAPWLADIGLDESAVDQLIEYLGTALLALESLPTQQRIVFERFFDESGDTHLVIHSPFGSRINRAWGLALRKRFCRRFNFELQAAALEDSIVLSLSATHSFPLEEVRGYLKAAKVVDVLTQALLDAPIFATRWRWNATTALAVRRNRNGKRVAPQLQRMDAEDLIAVVFPDQLACLENIAGEREVPDHPLVQQTLRDCLYEAMDVDGLQRLLRDIEAERIDVATCDLALPSPLAQEILTARPYAFL
ncbi:MAG TPA: helicase-related protein, partial [Arenicellales bacterium]|nr:helicase-related protein [Arenicellales bacterium]